MKRAPSPIPEEPASKKSRTDATLRPTTVVRIRRQRGFVTQTCDIYIGRRVARGGWDLDASKWANPFSVKECGSAEAAVAKYRDYLAQHPELMAALPELRGRVLGCWCKPGPCHGDVLAALADDPVPESQ